MKDVMEASARRYAGFFTHLKETDLDRLVEVFTPDARFKDPFNDVSGLDGIEMVFRHMFRNCPEPRFYIHAWAVKDNTAYFHWRFTDREDNGVSGMRLDVDGMSRVLFNDSGLVISHVDYWDAAEYLYEQIPVLSAAIRFVKRRITA